MAMLTGDDSRTYEAYSTVSNALEIPLVNWNLSPTSPMETLSNMYGTSECRAT